MFCVCIIWLMQEELKKSWHQCSGYIQPNSVSQGEMLMWAEREESWLRFRVSYPVSPLSVQHIRQSQNSTANYGFSTVQYRACLKEGHSFHINTQTDLQAFECSLQQKVYNVFAFCVTRWQHFTCFYGSNVNQQHIWLMVAWLFLCYRIM